MLSSLPEAYRGDAARPFSEVCSERTRSHRLKEIVAKEKAFGEMTGVESLE